MRLVKDGLAVLRHQHDTREPAGRRFGDKVTLEIVDAGQLVVRTALPARRRMTGFAADGADLRVAVGRVGLNLEDEGLATAELELGAQRSHRHGAQQPRLAQVLPKLGEHLLQLLVVVLLAKRWGDLVIDECLKGRVTAALKQAAEADDSLVPRGVGIGLLGPGRLDRRQADQDGNH